MFCLCRLSFLNICWVLERWREKIRRCCERVATTAAMHKYSKKVFLDVHLVRTPYYELVGRPSKLLNDSIRFKFMKSDMTPAASRCFTFREMARSKRLRRWDGSADGAVELKNDLCAIQYCTTKKEEAERQVWWPFWRANRKYDNRAPFWNGSAEIPRWDVFQVLSRYQTWRAQDRSWASKRCHNQTKPHVTDCDGLRFPESSPRTFRRRDKHCSKILLVSKR